jgi:hypothetical protein
MGWPGRLYHWAKPSPQGHEPDSGPILYIIFLFLESISELNFHKFNQGFKIIENRIKLGKIHSKFL